ncbi:PIF1 [Mytilus coruscus]|uniref:PIF1 n=1 Tax=Mytilus coruscus TaxID=42192 RepID=A0A6J8BET4_MYTCO|nr:PIF1 [Mytilus coruscus]
MEFCTESSPVKQLRETPAIVKDKNGSLRLEKARDHPMLVQHSRFHSQDWRANGDISLIVSKSDADNPSVDDNLATENMCVVMHARVISGKVPVLTGCNIQASWPLDENYCRTMLFLHTPNWQQLLDVKNDNLSWVHQMESFLQTDVCPNFVKSDIEKARKHISDDNQEDDIPISSEQCVTLSLHSFLKIPTHKKGLEMKPPEGILGENLQSNCDGDKVLLLPPVLDSPVFNSTSKIPASLHGVLVWNEFNCAVNLQNIVRQGINEQQLKNVLLAWREYKSTSEHAHLLQKFQWHNLKHSHGECLLKRMSANGLFVFPTHQEVVTHNKLKSIEVNAQFPIARVNAVSSGFHSKSSESNRPGGLQQTLYLCKSAKVMLSVNIYVPFCLFNGAIGNIVDIIDLNSYTGSAFIEHNPKLVPIFPVERKLDCRCNSCRGKQILLRLGLASTIHRCQGMTIAKGEPNSYIIINPGSRAFESRTPGALFVALSRAKSAWNDKLDPDFAWHPSVLVNEDRLCHVVTTHTVKARNNEIERISRLCIQTNTKYAILEKDQGLLYFY